MDQLFAARRDSDRAGLCAGFDGAPSCIADARDSAAGFLARHAPHAPAAFRTNMLLVVSELVTNAVRHAPGPLTLRLAPAADGLDVCVEDGSPDPPRARAPDPCHGTGGFGWPIVQSLASRVYSVPSRSGKAIHAVLVW